jgi:hypothetical protein
MRKFEKIYSTEYYGTRHRNPRCNTSMKDEGRRVTIILLYLGLWAWASHVAQPSAFTGVIYLKHQRGAAVKTLQIILVKLRNLSKWNES